MSEQIEMVLCACGCGQLRPKYDNRGRERKFINNHQNKILSEKRQQLGEKVRVREEKTCSICKEIKNLHEFTTAKNSPDGRSYICKICSATNLRKLRKKYPERFNTDKRRKYNKERQQRIREEKRKAIINKLGEKCVNCGKKDPRILQIDHINDDGFKDPHKVKVKDYTKYYYNLLNLPDEEIFVNYQLLCANCNWIKRYRNRSLKYIRKNASKKVIERLGRKCVSCGETDIRALQIDHIYSGGKNEIDKFKNVPRYYKHLLDLPLSDLKINYQVLCANCNWIKRKKNKEYKNQ